MLYCTVLYCTVLNCRYNIVLFLVTYLLPMVGMMLCYLQMGVHLWQGDASTDISNMTSHPAIIKSRQNKKRVLYRYLFIHRIGLVTFQTQDIEF